MLTNNPYHELFRLTPVPTVLLSVQEEVVTVIEANLAYLDFVGITATTVVGKDFTAFMENESENPTLHLYGLAINKSINHVLKTRKENSINLTLKSLEVQNTPILAENGKLKFIMHVVKRVGIYQLTEKLLSSIISNTEEAFIVLNRDLLITSFNEKFCKLYLTYFGIEVVEGESILAYAQSKRIVLLKKIYQSVLEGNIEHSTIDFVCESEIKKISFKYSPLTDEQQHVIGVFVTVTDIIATTNFEVQLKIREQELSLIYDNLVEIIFLIGVEDNKRFKFISINKAFTLASGLTEAQVEGKYVEEIISEPILSTMLSKYKQAIATKLHVSWEEAFMYASSKKTGIISINPIFDNQGNCIELIGSVYDITERVNAEHDKQIANELLGKIMDSSLDIICAINKDGEFVTVSAAAERIWGYIPAMLVGKSYIEFVHEDDRALTTRIAQLVMEGLETTNFENRYIRNDGSIIPIIWSARWDKQEEMMYCTAKDGTDSVKSEKELHESEQRFKSLVQEGSDMIGILDVEGNYQYVSPTSMAVLGMLPEEFIGKSAFNFIHPDDVEGVFANFDRVREEKKVSLSPFRFKHKNGDWRWIETVATDLLDDPSIKGIVTNSRDVTHKINAQKESLLINERYKYVTKATSDAIWDWDLVTNELYWGEGFQFLFGYKSSDLSTDISSWLEKIHPKDLKKVMKGVNRVIASTDQTNWMDEYRYLNANGDYAYVQDKGFVIRDEQGKVIRMVGAVQDISKRRREEQQRKLLESVITNTTDSVLITEAEPIHGDGPLILYVNDAFTKMTGYTADQVIGKTPRIFQGPKTDRIELDRLKAHLKNWEPCEITLVNYKKNGEEFWCNLSITPVADEKGWFTHWIWIERDVTERKNQEIQKILLTDISQLFNKTQTLTETLSKVLQTIISVGNYCAAEIWLVDEDKHELNLLTKYSVDKKMEQFYVETKERVKYKFGEGLPGEVWESKMRQIWEVNANNLYTFKKAAQKAQITKGIGLPLFNNDEINGVLMLGTREREKISGSIVLSENFGQHLGAEIKRKQIEQELNQLFSFAPDIIAISNFEGYFKKINPAACDLLEYSLEEFLDRPITNFLHPEDRENLIYQINTDRKNSETTYYENRYITKSGRIKWLAWASNTIVEEGLIFSVAKDITDEKNLRNLLLKSNSMGKVGSWEIDIISGNVYWSEITHEIRETEASFIPSLETGIHYFKEGRDKETITQKVNDCKANGIPWDEELQIITFKGNLKWIRTIGQAEMVDGKCIRIYGSFQDIDERKKAELKVRQAVIELEESEKRYSDLFHLSPLSMWVYDTETMRFLDVNQTALKHYGYSYDEFLSMTLEDIRPVEEIPHLKEAIQTSTESGALFYEGVFVHQNKKGAYLNVEVKSNIILFKGKKAKVIVANDITERIAYFNTLEQQNKKLQEISWIQSHIIRAPLARLMGLIYLLKDKSAQTELSEESIIGHIEHSAEELDSKIREIIEKSDHKEI